MTRSVTRRSLLRDLGLVAGAAHLAPPVLWAQAAVADAGQTSAPAQEITGKGSLKAHAEACGLGIGAAVSVPLLRANEIYRRVLAEQYTMVVGENCMKWAQTQPRPDTYDFAESTLR